ncbi:hypothetical protein D3C72_1981990 [compost metagenome]
MHEHAREQDKSKLPLVLFAARSPAGLEYDGEDERVDGQHHHRVEEGPRQSQRGAAISSNDIALAHLEDELAMPQQAAHQ